MRAELSDASFHIAPLDPVLAGLLRHRDSDFCNARIRINWDSQLAIAVGTAVAGCPPHGPGRALISASGSYLG
jgi:hypothetical protein